MRFSSHPFLQPRSVTVVKVVHFCSASSLQPCGAPSSLVTNRLTVSARRFKWALGIRRERARSRFTQRLPAYDTQTHKICTLAGDSLCPPVAPEFDRCVKIPLLLNARREADRCATPESPKNATAASVANPPPPPFDRIGTSAAPPDSRSREREVNQTTRFQIGFFLFFSRGRRERKMEEQWAAKRIRRSH